MVAKKNPDTDNKMMTVVTHLLAIFVGILGPLIVLVASKEVEVQNHAKKALNWQITYLALSIFIGGVLFVGAFGSIILMMINPAFILFYFLSFLLIIPLIILGIVNLIFCIIAAVKANEGILWNYPFAFELLKTE
jgi:uncharacterized Tic20 family protein